MPTTLAGQGGHSGIGQPQGARVCGVRVEDPDSSIVILKKQNKGFMSSHTIVSIDPVVTKLHKVLIVTMLHKDPII